MKAKKFLQTLDIVAQDNDDLVIVFDDGRDVSVVELLERYTQDLEAELERVKAEKKSWQKALIESDASKNLGRAIEAESLLKKAQAENERLRKGIEEFKWVAIGAITSVGVANLSNYKENAELSKKCVSEKAQELLKEKP